MQSERLVYVPGDDGSGLYGHKVKLECMPGFHQRSEYQRVKRRLEF